MSGQEAEQCNTIKCTTFWTYTGLHRKDTIIQYKIPLLTFLHYNLSWHCIEVIALYSCLQKPHNLNTNSIRLLGKRKAKAETNARCKLSYSTNEKRRMYGDDGDNSESNNAYGDKAKPKPHRD